MVFGNYFGLTVALQYLIDLKILVKLYIVFKTLLLLSKNFGAGKKQLLECLQIGSKSFCPSIRNNTKKTVGESLFEVVKFSTWQQPLAVACVLALQKSFVVSFGSPSGYQIPKVEMPR